MTEDMLGPVYNPATPRAVILQRYLALTSQQSTLRREISNTNSPPPMSTTTDSPSSPTMSSSTTSSASGSPTLEARHCTAISPPAFALPPRRRSSIKSPAIEPIPEDDVPDLALQIPQTPTQDQLYHVNYEIKSTLTDLLNCEAVRNDSKMRLWIQSRLMDAELELKRQRRRRSSTPTPTITLTPSPDETFRERSI